MLSVKSFKRKLDLCDASVSILTLGTVGKPWQQKGADLIFSTPVALRWWSHLRCHCRKWLQWALKSFIVLDSLAMVRQPCVVKEIWCRKAAVEDNTSIQAEGNSSADGKRGMRWNVMTAIWLLFRTRKKKKKTIRSFSFEQNFMSLRCRIEHSCEVLDHFFSQSVSLYPALYRSDVCFQIIDPLAEQIAFNFIWMAAHQFSLWLCLNTVEL